MNEEKDKQQDGKNNGAILAPMARAPAGIDQHLNFSNISVENVMKHLETLNEIYLDTRSLNSVELYKYLMEEERNYIRDRDCNNFCSMVHKMHPFYYREDMLYGDRNENSTWSTQSKLLCISCQTPLTISSCFEIHILGKPITCDVCSHTFTYETLTLRCMTERYNENKKSISSDESFQSLFPESLNGNAITWLGFSLEMKQLLSDCHPDDIQLIIIDLVQKYHNNISCFSVDLVKAMYRQLDVINKICSNYEYWNKYAICVESIDRYHKFMYLMKNTEKILVPTFDILLVWNTHMTRDVTKYLADTKVCCGREIDYSNNSIHADFKTAYTKTFIKYSQAYNEPYANKNPSFKRWQEDKWPVSVLLFPVGISRASEWNKHSQTRPMPIQMLSVGGDMPPKRAIIGTPVHDDTVRPAGTVFYKSLSQTLEALNLLHKYDPDGGRGYEDL